MSRLKMKVSSMMLLLAVVVATGATMTSAYAQQNGESMEAMEAMEAPPQCPHHHLLQDSQSTSLAL